MARWSIVVWVGLAVAAAALLVPGAMSSANRGSVFWILLALTAVTAVLAWLAARGSPRNRWLLLLSAAALTVLSALAAGLVVGLAFGQSPPIDVIGWPIVAVGSALALIGSIMSLRSVEAPR